MAKYLDLNGLRIFWGKIKDYVNNAYTGERNVVNISSNHEISLNIAKDNLTKGALNIVRYGAGELDYTLHGIKSPVVFGDFDKIYHYEDNIINDNAEAETIKNVHYVYIPSIGEFSPFTTKEYVDNKIKDNIHDSKQGLTVTNIGGTNYLYNSSTLKSKISLYLNDMDNTIDNFNKSVEFWVLPYQHIKINSGHILIGGLYQSGDEIKTEYYNDNETSIKVTIYSISLSKIEVEIDYIKYLNENYLKVKFANTNDINILNGNDYTNLDSQKIIIVDNNSTKEIFSQPITVNEYWEKENSSDSIEKIHFKYNSISLRKGDSIKWIISVKDVEYNTVIPGSNDNNFLLLTPFIYVKNGNTYNEMLSTYDDIPSQSSLSDHSVEIETGLINDNLDISYIGLKLYNEETSISNVDTLLQNYNIQYCIKSKSDPGLYIKKDNDEIIKLTSGESLLNKILTLESLISLLKERVSNLENSNSGGQ